MFRANPIYLLFEITSLFFILLSTPSIAQEFSPIEELQVSETTREILLELKKAYRFPWIIGDLAVMSEDDLAQVRYLKTNGQSQWLEFSKEAIEEIKLQLQALGLSLGYQRILFLTSSDTGLKLYASGLRTEEELLALNTNPGWTILELNDANKRLIKHATLKHQLLSAPNGVSRQTILDAPMVALPLPPDVLSAFLDEELYRVHYIPENEKEFPITVQDWTQFSLRDLKWYLSAVTSRRPSRKQFFEYMKKYNVRFGQSDLNHLKLEFEYRRTLFRDGILTLSQLAQLELPEILKIWETGFIGRQRIWDKAEVQSFLKRSDPERYAGETLASYYKDAYYGCHSLPRRVRKALDDYSENYSFPVTLGDLALMSIADLAQLVGAGDAHIVQNKLKILGLNLGEGRFISEAGITGGLQLYAERKVNTSSQANSLDADESSSCDPLMNGVAYSKPGK